MKYVSIDIETTGLDPAKHQIIEFAAVLDDLEEQKPVVDLPFIRILIYRDEWIVNPYCAVLHAKLFQEMQNRAKNPCDSLHVDHADMMVYEKSVGLNSRFAYWLEDHDIAKQNDGRLKINVAGKNFASFDLQFLKQPAYNIQSTIDIRHRIIDVASHFWIPTDESLPDTNTCLKRAGIEGETDHTALSDARNVVSLVRKALAK